MKQGIIYFNQGTKVLIRIAVSTYTLRKVYDGNISVIFVGSPPPWFIDHANKYNIDICHAEHHDYALVQKTRLHKYTPYDRSIFIDGDTIILKDPTPLFKCIDNPSGFFTTKFSDWKSDGRRIKQRINVWRPLVGNTICDRAIKYGPAVNTGVFGFRKDAPILDEWNLITQQASQVDYTIKRVLDEIGCQILAPKYGITMVGEEWNRSVTHGITNDPSILHFHGGKHLLDSQSICEVWKKYYWELRHTSYDESLANPLYDRQMNLGKYLKRTVKSDLTICMAATESHAAKLTKSFKQLMTIPGLREQHFIIFAVNAPITHRSFRELASYSNVVLYSHTHRNVTNREAAFSAFVFGTAKRVATPYWMKIDGDVRPNPEANGLFEWPNYRKATITADPWHYTKVKGDDNATKHWLNILDEWSGHSKFPPIDVSKVHKHERCRSFAWIERTEFTKQLAAMCGDRLPVPSHDTTSWYVAYIANETIKRYSFRKFLKP